MQESSDQSIDQRKTPKIWVLTLFPNHFKEFISTGVIGRLFSDKSVEIECLYLGDFSPKSFKGVDGTPYGGGPGMVMRADVLKACLDEVINLGGYKNPKEDLEVIYTAPRGKVFNNNDAHELKEKFIERERDLVFICGRYEGIDERFIESYVDQIYSIGDFVLSGGELAVQCIIDSLCRFLPSALGNDQSAAQDSFEDGLIEGPIYTKPRDFEGKEVPKELLSGNHKLIKSYNEAKKVEYTKKYRPDLYNEYRKTKS